MSRAANTLAPPLGVRVRQCLSRRSCGLQRRDPLPKLLCADLLSYKCSAPHSYSLPDHVARTVACSIVSSHLDYCNAMYVGMSADDFKKLQRVQNTLARATLKLHKSDHITPSLTRLRCINLSTLNWLHQCDVFVEKSHAAID